LVGEQRASAIRHGEPAVDLGAARRPEDAGDREAGDQGQHGVAPPTLESIAGTRPAAAGVGGAGGGGGGRHRVVHVVGSAGWVERCRRPNAPAFNSLAIVTARSTDGSAASAAV